MAATTTFSLTKSTRTEDECERSKIGKGPKHLRSFLVSKRLAEFLRTKHEPRPSPTRAAPPPRYYGGLLSARLRELHGAVSLVRRRLL